jgi:hypothetical protein
MRIDVLTVVVVLPLVLRGVRHEAGALLRVTRDEADALLRDGRVRLEPLPKPRMRRRGSIGAVPDYR